MSETKTVGDGIKEMVREIQSCNSGKELHKWSKGRTRETGTETLGKLKTNQLKPPKSLAKATRMAAVTSFGKVGRHPRNGKADLLFGVIAHRLLFKL